MIPDSTSMFNQPLHHLSGLEALAENGDRTTFLYTMEEGASLLKNKPS
jgi:hypothetical protein